MLETYYAKKWRNIDVRLDAYIPSTGLFTATSYELYENSERHWQLGTTSADASVDLYVLDKGYAQMVMPALKEKEIQFTVLPPHYGGPLSIANLTIVHIPYQVSSQQLPIAQVAFSVLY